MSSPHSLYHSSITQIISLPTTSATPVEDVDKENKPFCGYKILGGVLSDNKHVWNANGSNFTLFNAKTGNKIASWSFGSVVRTLSVTITCVAELHRGSGKLPLLIIGLENGTKGQVCVFDIRGSRVLRCIDIETKVTSLCVIDSNYNICALAQSLHMFDGLLAAGTTSGNLYLIDICRLNCEEVLFAADVDIKDEVNPCELEVLLPTDEQLLNISHFNSKHLSIHLNAIEGDIQHFVLKGPKGDNRIFVNKEEVIISALHYCAPLGSLLVGYNFGAWQLWDLINLRLVYTSPVYEENIPISHFAIQEPSDDPRAFCYVWVIYSSLESDQYGYPVAVLYSLNYENKEFLENHGMLYKNLTTCSVRFQMELTTDEDKAEKENISKGGQCIRVQTINKTVSRNLLVDNQEETMTICSIVWNGWNSNLPNQYKTYMSLFDLNQWYKEQMPRSPISHNYESYMSRFCFGDLLQMNDSNSQILDMRINSETLTQFVGSQKLEEHYYPSSLAFEAYVLKGNSIVVISNQGNQRALMSSLEVNGPSMLLNPSETFLLCIDLGLTPLFIDVPSKTSTSSDYEREFILSVALEQQLLGWLCKCVTTWSSGICTSQGCSLNFLLSWGWKRAQVLNENANKLSETLFDYSGLKLDTNNHNLLNSCSRQLKNLSTIFKFVVRKFLGFVLNSDIVEDQSKCLEMVSTYLEVLQWLLNIGLLPECPTSSYPRTDEFNRINAPYPVDTLTKYYDDRRKYLKTINKEKCNTLFIDSFLESECGGNNLQKQWIAHRGSGMYPPPSLQALMHTYLIDNVALSNKHCVLMYLFLDLSATLDQDRYSSTITHLLKFPMVFHVSPSLAKITQSFWQLDHGDFNVAIEQLIDPIIANDNLKLWHHRVALNALLSQQQYNLALLYLQVRQPVAREIDDLCTVLSLYVTNNMIDEAFHFQRRHQSLSVTSKLLRHFYEECDKLQHMETILSYPLTKEEEANLMKYLNDVNHPNEYKWQIFYYTQHSRYIDALQTKDKASKVPVKSRGLQGQETLSDTDFVITRLKDMSDPLSKSFLTQYRKSEVRAHKEVQKPQPFSVFVHNSEEQAKYKSSIIEAGLLKAKETWSHPTLSDRTIKNELMETDEAVPFLSTPKAMLPCPRILTPLIYPKLTPVKSEEDYIPPSKKLKPTSRLSTVSSKQDSPITCRQLSVFLDTPIVKRKLPRLSLEKLERKRNEETPHSILKVHKTTDSLNADESIQSNKAYNLHDPFSDNTLSKEHKNLGLTPRRSLIDGSRPAVRFSFSKPPSESSVSSNGDGDFQIIKEEVMVHSPLEGKESISLGNPHSVDDFILSESENIVTSTIENKDLSNKTSVVSEIQKTPKSRRSYKELAEVNIRSSPRLQKYKSDTVEIVDSSLGKIPDSNNEEIEKNTTIAEPCKTPRSRRSLRYSTPLTSQASVKRSNINELIDSSKSKRTIKNRKSLTRKTLENNTFNRIVEFEKRYSSSTTNLINDSIDSEFDKSENKFTDEEESYTSFEDLQFDKSIIANDSNVNSNVQRSIRRSNINELKDSSNGKQRNETKKSLTRKVLENNAISRIVEFEKKCSSPTMNFINDSVDSEFDESLNNFTAEEEGNWVFEDLEFDKSSIADDSNASSNEQVRNEDGEQDENNIIEKCSEDANINIEIDTDINQQMLSNSKSISKEKEMNVCEVKIDTFDIYNDLSEDEADEATDPRLSTLQIPDDTNQNEPLDSGDIVKVEVSSTYNVNESEIFVDESEVLNIESINQFTATVDNGFNINAHEDVIEDKVESKKLINNSSSSGITIIELSSSSEGENQKENNSFSSEKSALEGEVDYNNSTSLSDSSTYSTNGKEAIAISFEEKSDSSELNIVAEQNIEVSVVELDNSNFLNTIHEKEIECEESDNKEKGTVINEQTNLKWTLEVSKSQEDNDKYHLNTSEDSTVKEETKIASEHKELSEEKELMSDVVTSEQKNLPLILENKEDTVEHQISQNEDVVKSKIQDTSQILSESKETKTTIVSVTNEQANLQSILEDKKEENDGENQGNTNENSKSQTESVKKEIVKDTVINEQTNSKSILKESENVKVQKNTIENDMVKGHSEVVKHTDILGESTVKRVVNDSVNPFSEKSSIDNVNVTPNPAHSNKLFNASTPMSSSNRNQDTHIFEDTSNKSDSNRLYLQNLMNTPQQKIECDSSFDLNHTPQQVVKHMKCVDDNSVNAFSERKIIDNSNININPAHSNKNFLASTPLSSCNRNQDTHIFDETPNKSDNNGLNIQQVVYDSSFDLNHTPEQKSSSYCELISLPPVTHVSSSHTSSDTSNLRKYTLRRRNLSGSQSNLSDNSTKLKLTSIEENKIPVRRKRSLSSTIQGSLLDRKKRGSSVDVELLSGNKGIPIERNISNLKLDAIGTTKVMDSLKLESHEIPVDYSNSRRLTRSQANLLKKNLSLSSVNVSKDVYKTDSEDQNLLSLPEIDTIELLDKKSFQGDPDPEEEMVHKSPASSVTENSPKQFRLKGSSSCNTSFSEISGARSSKKSTKNTDSESLQPMKQNVPLRVGARKLRKTRMQSSDSDISCNSIISETHSELIVKKPGRITRRTLSADNTAQEPLRRSERKLAVKTELPKIPEENILTTTGSRKRTASKRRK